MTLDARSETPLPPANAADAMGTHAAEAHPHQSFWLWVMCLTGVDYFSTLGYQPSIAFEAAGLLAPLATVVLVLVTLLRRAAGLLLRRRAVAARAGLDRHARAAGARLDRQDLVLVLLGFAATDFVITKTLSAADAAEHLIHNPLWEYAPAWMHALTEDRQRLIVTMVLLVMLGAMFMRGFREVIGLAVVIVGRLPGAQCHRHRQRPGLSGDPSAAIQRLAPAGRRRRMASAGSDPSRQRLVDASWPSCC